MGRERKFEVSGLNQDTLLAEADKLIEEEVHTQHFGRWQEQMPVTASQSAGFKGLWERSPLTERTTASSSRGSGKWADVDEPGWGRNGIIAFDFVRNQEQSPAQTPRTTPRRRFSELDEFKFPTPQSGQRRGRRHSDTSALQPVSPFDFPHEERAGRKDVTAMPSQSLQSSLEEERRKVEEERQEWLRRRIG